VEKLFLVDGSAIAYRSFFALRKQDLRTSRGEPTGAVYGYTRFIMKLLKDFQPEFMAVCFDTAKPTFRHRRYPEYKATREKAPDELRSQIPRIIEVTSALGIPIFELEGYEADDVIGTLARKAEAHGMDVYLVSSDKDFLQLVNERTRVLNPMRTGEEIYIYDTEKVRERYGVEPEKVVDVLGLAGDVSDNVPGVPGIGEKTATRLIKKYGSVENLLSSVDTISKSVLKENLSKSAETALLSKELVSIRTDLDIVQDFEQLTQRDMDTPSLVRIFRDLEFFSLLSEIPQEEVAVEYSEIEATQLLPKLLAAKKFGFILNHGIAVSFKSGEIFLTTEPEALSPAFESPEVEKISSNLKEDIFLLKKRGIELHGKVFDLSLASYLLRPSQKLRTLRHLALEYLDKRMLQDAANPEEELCALVGIHFPLAAALEEAVKKTNLADLYWKVEVPLARVLSDMEEYGVLIDNGHFAKMSEALGKRLTALADELYSIAGFTFNLNSPSQLRKVLFDTLNLPRGKRTKTGYSTDTEVLARLATQHPFPKLLLEYRMLFKLKSTYVDAIPKLAHPQTDRIHTSFNQMVTSTGRLSSSNPNLQNIPMRSELGKEIRKGFIAPQGSYILSADYSQIELRILAHLSGDENLIRAFKTGEDIHTRTAALVFGVPENKVSPEHRRKAKVVNFGTIYGISPFGLARELDITSEEAASFIREYFLVFPGVKSWIDQTVEKAREDGYVKTMLNRIRYLPDIVSKNRSRREFAERTAINTPIQGTAADLIKLAMVNIHNCLREMEARLILQIHDELILEIPEVEIQAAKEMVGREMASPLPLSIPIVVEVGVGKSWYEAH